MTVKHTETPWTVETYGTDTPYGFSLIRGPMGELICQDIGRDHARQIVQACNAHAELVAVLRDVVEADMPASVRAAIKRASVVLAKLNTSSGGGK